MRQINAKILSNLRLGPYYYKMVLEIGRLDERIRPGQFINIKITDFMDPFLRRPFSIHRIGPNQKVIEILYKVVGRGTALLSRRSRGTPLDIILPLGNGFSIDENVSAFILVAGGMGVAPLLGLADELAQNRKNKLSVIIGAKTKEFLLCKDEFKAIGADTQMVTEDGSYGKKALATDILAQVLEKTKSSLVIAGNRADVCGYACGPYGMLKEVAKLIKRYRINCLASFEEHMSCGIGACMGCSLLTADGYKRVCYDGPVFDISKVVFK